jgi:hypothetical protein
MSLKRKAVVDLSTSLYPAMSTKTAQLASTGTKATSAITTTKRKQENGAGKGGLNGNSHDSAVGANLFVGGKSNSEHSFVIPSHFYSLNRLSCDGNGTHHYGESNGSTNMSMSTRSAQNVRSNGHAVLNGARHANNNNNSSSINSGCLSSSLLAGVASSHRSADSASPIGSVLGAFSSLSSLSSARSASLRSSPSSMDLMESSSSSMCSTDDNSAIEQGSNYYRRSKRIKCQHQLVASGSSSANNSSDSFGSSKSLCTTITVGSTSTSSTAATKSSLFKTNSANAVNAANSIETLTNGHSLRARGVTREALKMAYATFERSIKQERQEPPQHDVHETESEHDKHSSCAMTHSSDASRRSSSTRSSPSSSLSKFASNKAAQSKQQPQQSAPTKKICMWQKCLFTSDSADADELMIEHVKQQHIQPQKNNKRFKCMWKGCSVIGRMSSSYLWLERHVIDHVDSKPFICIFNGCKRKFRTEAARERHVQTHINMSENGGGGGSGAYANMNGSNSASNSPSPIKTRNRRLFISAKQAILQKIRNKAKLNGMRASTSMIDLTQDNRTADLSVVIIDDEIEKNDATDANTRQISRSKSMLRPTAATSNRSKNSVKPLARLLSFIF